MSLLEVSGISCSFGALKAVSDFNLKLEAGELLGLIGPNGSGKTTVFNVLTGIYKPQEGSVLLNGLDITGLPPEQIAACGVARTFQNIRLFREMTVLDNVRVAYCHNASYYIGGAIFRSARFRQSEKRIHEAAMRLLSSLQLDAHAFELAKNLPYGLQRRLEIARALALSPKLLLLDEPAAGMNPHEIDALGDFILWVKGQFGLSIILVEHQMRLVMRICPRIKVLDFGETIADGTPDSVRANPEVLRAYLGDEQ